ncbi:DUF523 and DUF1722 domain-containing protein [uncultured Pseudodesulfovibrio sp.]|uniref:YbgA family protein n=1 Tax=uncultured Pseudodesulfovibrio sp. TaxID=2035858 RepID=UPI0029C6BFEF|nr:DUF523 and DUF1722 domain-containing protein [uncultured Pseudodesulfovibrio sp.]
MSENVKIGVSACLIGEKVRWNGMHERDRYLSEILAKHVEFIPLCPEIACGMGIPREQLRQTDCAENIRLIGYESGDDLTQKMTDWADRVLPGLEKEDLNGFVLKPRSPSCGMRHAKIYSTTGKPPRLGSGFFARKLMTYASLLPIETSDRLQNPIVRENFIRRVFVYKRWNQMLSKGKSIGNLVDFHTRHKMLIRAHDLRGYKELGSLLGQANQSNTDTTFNNYATLLFKTMTLKATAKKNSDVLFHAMGFFKKQLDLGDKQELQTAITAYQNGMIPLLIPVTLLNHYARKYQKPYLTQQYYLNPSPTELQLLNHV